MGKHLVVVGAGHAHLTVLKNLQEFKKSGHRVTVISPKVYQYYSGMGPGMLSGIYQPEEVRFDVRKMSEDRGGVFLEDEVLRIDPKKKRLYLQSGQEQAYDIASFNTGSFVPFNREAAWHETVFTVKPIENLLQARERIIECLEKKTLKITVAGGGPTGVEVSANIHRLIADRGGKAEILLVAGPRLLARFRESVRRRARRSLGRRNIKVIEGAKLKDVRGGFAELTDGSAVKTDFTFVAVGTRPSPLFRASSLPTDTEGGLLVNAYLQSVSYPEIFGAGDCIGFEPQPLAKVGVYAVRQNPVLLHNLWCSLSFCNYKEFVPQKSFLLIFNMGDGTGIAHWNSLVWEGRIPFMLKNYIDCRFMRTFQVSGERRFVSP